MSEFVVEPKTQIRVTIRGILILMGSVAIVLALGNHWQDGGGFFLASIVCAIPMSFVIEFAFASNRPRSFALSKRSIAVRVILLLLLSPLAALVAWVGLVDQGSWWSPCPMLVFISYAYLETFGYLFLVVPMLTFLTVTLPSTFNSEIRYLPIRSFALFCIAVAGSIYWFASSMPFTFKYQSPNYIYGSIAANSIAILMLAVSGFAFRGYFNFMSAAIWNLTLVCWLFWIAFPWIGEYI
jgi:hypothetical protein